MLFASVAYLGFSQQEPTLSQYMLATYNFNPGYAGLSNNLCASAFYRQQWLGMKGVASSDASSSTPGTGSGTGTSTSGKNSLSPFNVHLVADMPIKFLHGGIGLEINTATAAQFSDVFIKVGYAYHLQTYIGTIGMGIQAQFCNKSIDWASFFPEEQGDPIISGKTKENNGAFLADAGIGFYLQGNQNYFVGLAFNNIIGSRKEDIGWSTMRNVVLNGGYSFTFPDLPKIEFSPMTRLTLVLPGNSDVRYNTGIYWDISLLATFNKQFYGGLSYRLRDAVSFLVGFNLPKAPLRIGVCYDVATTKIIKASLIGGSLELSVRYCFAIETDRNNSSYKNSRYL